MKIIVLGTGCKNCKTLEEYTKKAVEELGIDAQIEKEEDIQKIMAYGIMRTPGLVVDEMVVMSGKVPKVEEIKEMLSKFA